MQIQDVLSRYEADLKNVEEHMRRHFHSDVPLIPEISNHLISSGGKRFRPLLLLISSDLCGYRGERRYYLSAVLEFIHTASLLHDDVIDHASTRRGRASANSVWGNSASVLVGDFLYSKSFKMMTDDGDPSIINLLSTITNTMAEGEVFQLIKCGDMDITEKEYFSLIEKKTAILISAACALGAILSKASDKKISALMKFGMRLGTAFQLTDDTLDYSGTEQEFGKAIGTDLREGKITLPLINTLVKCSPAERTLIKKIVKKKDSGEKDIQRIVAIINKHNGIEYALDRAKACIQEGKKFLDLFADSEPKRALFTISDFILGRKL
ncbi:MAG: polyprenyl synthetase family protein [Syntrophales bacterium]